MSDLDRVLAKIKKCLALATSPEPHEAAAALRQAQKLMAQHNIDQAQLHAAEVTEGRVKSKTSVSRLNPWELSLIKMVARAFGCRALWSRSRSDAADVFGEYVLIGLKAQVMLAEHTAIVLLRRLLKARRLFIATMPVGLGASYKTMEADGFCAGWVEAVAAAVHELALEPEQRAAIDARVQARSGGHQTQARAQALGAHGREAGLAAGANERLHRPMHAGQDNLRLGA